jgi:integrase
MNAMTMTETIMGMIKTAGVPAEEIAAALLKAAAKTKGKPTLISTQAQAEKAGSGAYRAKGKGLYLNKGANGSGAWFFRFRFSDGKRHEMGLGALGEVKLIEAQDRADEARQQVKAGVNPITERRAVKTAAIAKTDRWTFKKATEEYVAAHAASWKHRDARRNWFNPVERYAYPVIGRMLLDDIRVEHVAAAMDAAEEGGAPVLAAKIRGRIEQVISAGIALGKRDASLGNPAASKLLKAVRPSARKGAAEHYRRLDLDAAPAALQQLRQLAEASTAFAAWVFMIACASRPSEALNARWDEIDLAKKLWTVPKERAKTERDHVVPLSDLAIEVLARQAKVRTGEAVFPGRSGSPVGYSSFARAPMEAGLDTGSPHSWRSIFRDWAGDIGRVDRDLAEAALAHSLGAVEGAYRRQSAITARRPVMEAYSRWLTDEAADIIAFKSRA